MINSNENIPIVYFAYNRPKHTIQSLESLKKNTLASESHLIIFIDGVKENEKEESILRVKEVQNIVQNIEWKGRVEYHISESNLGCRESIISGINYVFKTYDAVIVLEDDIVTSPYFLAYMNKTLKYYNEKKSVFSISAFNFPKDKIIYPENYKYDVFASLRTFNWGWGTWKDRWEQIEWSKNFIPNFLSNKNQVDAFCRGGDDLKRLLLDEFRGESDAWDIQFQYNQFINHGISIVPVLSYTNNIGLDGTGTHSGKSELKNDLLISKEFPELLDVLYLDSGIINSIYSIYYEKKRPILKKILNRITRFLTGKNLFFIKKKIYN